MRELLTEEAEELVKSQLTLVKGIASPLDVAVDAPIRGRDDENAVLGQQARCFGDHLFLLAYMLDDLERHYGTKGAVRVCREVHGRAHLKRQVGRLIVELTVFYGLGVHVYAKDALCRLRENRCTEALAASEVENSSASDETRSPEIAVKVLVRDLDVWSPRHATLAGPLDQARRCCTTPGAHVRASRPGCRAGAGWLWQRDRSNIVLSCGRVGSERRAGRYRRRPRQRSPRRRTCPPRRVSCSGSCSETAIADSVATAADC